MSPLRHYQGSIKPASTAWHCPSCHAEQTGPLEAGCQACGAGRDARKGEPPAPRTEAQAAVIDGPLPGTFVAPPNIEVAPDHRDEAYQQWRAFNLMPKGGGYSATAIEDLQHKAFMDGWVAAKAGTMVTHGSGTVGPEMPTPTTPAPTEEAGPKVLLYTAKVGEFVPAEVSGPTLSTIVAALAFYVENQLAYGPLPGQLSADQVRELLGQLLPAEEIPV